MRLSEAGEFGAIARLVRHAGAARGDVILGAGDDAAIVRPGPGEDLVLTTDAFVEGRHWKRGWLAPEAVGARLAAANLSDLAAMAAEPRWAVVAFGAAADDDAGELEALQSGLSRALAAHGAALVGGNLSSVSAERWAALTLVGAVASGGAWTRAGARPGDLLVATGSPGRAGAVERLLDRLGPTACEARFAGLLADWRAPASRVAFARALAACGGVRAAIDLSDGLAGDLGHLCDASGVGAALDLAAFAPDEPLERAAEALGTSAAALRLDPSDDYELLLALDPAHRDALESLAAEHGVALQFAGRITPPGEGRRVAGAASPSLPRGFDHFAR